MIGAIFPQQAILKGSLTTSGALQGKLTTTLPDGGFDIGYSKGHEAGRVVGHEEGYAEGKVDGYEEGHAVGHDEGRIVGREEGYSEGVTAGSASARGMLDKTITTFIDNELTIIPRYGFYYCKKLVSVTIPNVTEITYDGFYECTELTEVICPKLETLGNNAFYNCTKLKKVDLSEVTSIGKWEYASVEHICLPKVTTIPSYGFSRGSMLIIDLPIASSIGSSAFYNCSSCKTLILRKNDAICTLASTDAFNGCLIRSLGYIYVPAALIEEYKSATNWSTFAGRFRAIEDYPDICGGTT